MADKTLTAANSVYMLTVRNLFPAPQQLQGFAADDAFSTEQVQPAEVVMGVDGIMSAGWLPTMTPQTISLQADSASAEIFDAWVAAEKVARELYFADALISLPALGRSYVLTRGALTSYTAIVGVKKILQPRTFTITWNSVAAVPL